MAVLRNSPFRHSESRRISRNPNDWQCTACEENNFARRLSCFRCDTPRKDRKADDTPSPAAEMKQGDWLCDDCQTHNYARRGICYRCRKARTDGDDPKLTYKRGDWFCPTCKKQNFARRDKCITCETDRVQSKNYWVCPSTSCQFVNIGVRSKCRECQTPSPTDPMEFARRGDWKCSRCEHINFASRKSCQICSATFNVEGMKT